MTYSYDQVDSQMSTNSTDETVATSNNNNNTNSSSSSSSSTSSSSSAVQPGNERLVLISNDVDLQNFDLPHISSSMLRLITSDDGTTPYYQATVGLERHALKCTENAQDTISRVLESAGSSSLSELYIVLRVNHPKKLLNFVFQLRRHRNQLKVVHLVLVAYANEEQATDQARIEYNVALIALFKTLNRMPLLTTLKLDLQLTSGLESDIPLRLKVSSQLQLLDVTLSGFAGQRKNKVALEDVDVLKLTIGKCHKAREKQTSLPSLYSGNPLRLATLVELTRVIGCRLPAALHRLAIYDALSSSNYGQFEAFASQCCHLEELSVALQPKVVTVVMVARALVCCPELVHLSLSLHLAQVRCKRPYSGQLPVLSSVKSLRLDVLTGSHKDLKRIKLDVIFPNVQVIEMHYDLEGCRHCQLRLPKEIGQLNPSLQIAYGRLVHDCMRLARINLGRFRKLTVLRTNVGIRQIGSSYQDEVNFNRASLKEKTFDRFNKLPTP